MRWLDLLFLHWQVPADALRAQLPPGLALDTHDGAAYLGIVPFTMSHVGLRALPSLPPFPELNVRTYVTAEDKPGVWFFSLDAASRLAVLGGRRLFFLPYFRAAMRSGERGGSVHFVSRRAHGGAPAARFAARYRPVGEVAPTAPGTLDHFLTARYCLYAADGRRRLHRVEIDHAPWPLQAAEASIEENDLTAGLGLPLAGAPLAHFSRRLDVVAWERRRVRAA